ncbi:MAG: Stp1/IreP family PP2C-type Ser/Thr phosphatase [Candidatus Methanoperedens sp.]|nr:Stp1/IreP family PP2C-type Ser/Thr phosphatase [Candidatus Methanoperedens sp.]
MLDYCFITNKGSRDNNEDTLLTVTPEHNNRYYLFAVADGMGGHAAGEFASKIAITELKETIKEGFAATHAINLESMKQLLLMGFSKANLKISYQAKREYEKSGMGTTLVAVLLDSEGKGVVANVGDSRAYFVGDKIIRITKDHSYVQELVDGGIITKEEAAVHPRKNIVTRIIGMESVKPDFFEIELGKNTLLLCSDGLTDALSDEKIRDIIIYSEIENICKNLVETAKSNSRDNITIIAVKR